MGAIPDYESAIEIIKQQDEELATLRSENELLKAQVTEDELLSQIPDIQGPLHNWNVNARNQVRHAFNAIMRLRTQATQKGSE